MIQSPSEAQLAVVQHAVDIVAGILGISDPVVVTFVTPLEAAEPGAEPRFVFDLSAGDKRAPLALESGVIDEAQNEDVSGRLARQEIEKLTNEAIAGFTPDA